MASVMPLPPGSPPLQTTSATIPVVDDSPVNLRLVVRTLEGRGYRLLAAKNGRAALDIARRVHPDLILLDVMMPRLDGLRSMPCAEGRSRHARRDRRVLSALGEVTDKVTGLERGASDYITKPIQPEEVIARVANHVARQQLEREVRRSRDRLERELSQVPARCVASCRQRCPRGWARPCRLLPHQPLRRRRLLRRVRASRRPIRRHRRRRVRAGAPSAIVMAMIRAAVHAFPGFACDPAEMIRYLNRHFEFLWSPMFPRHLGTCRSARTQRHDRLRRTSTSAAAALMAESACSASTRRCRSC